MLELFDLAGANTSEMQHALCRILPDSLEGMRILDLSAGQGHHLRAFLERGPSKVTAVDLSSESLRMLRQRYQDQLERIETIQADITIWEACRRYHIVHLGDNSFQLFEPRYDQLQVLRSIHRHLLPEGVALINIVPLSLRAIIEYGQEFRIVRQEQSGDVSRLVACRLEIDVFRGRVVYHYRFILVGGEQPKIIRESQISYRFLLQDEVENMLSECGLCISYVDSMRLNAGTESLYYVCKPS